METAAIPPDSVNLRVDEDALVSQVLEIIGGITPEPFNTQVEPEDGDVWSLEEGDDSVFYSDEEPAECPHAKDSGTAGEPHKQKEGNPGEKEGIITEEHTETEQEPPPQVSEGEHQHLQTAKTEQTSTSDPAEPESELTPAKSERTCKEFLQSNEEKQTEQQTSAKKVNHVDMEGVVPEAQTANLKLFEEFNEKSFTSLNVEAQLPKQLSAGSPQQHQQIPGDRQPDMDRDAAQDLSIHVHGGFHQNISAGYSSTLPVMKKPACYQKAFNHLTSSKYSTVSYRRIRRGNTRQKIEEFEHLLMNQ